METALDNQYADELRRAKAAGSDSPLVKGGEGGLEGGEPRSFRERVMAARQALDLKERAKKKIEEKIMAPMKQGTNWLLRWAWGMLIPSFGLTLIYINMHIFLRQVFPDAFCKLGEEWKPKMVGESSATNVSGTAFGIVEIMGLLLLDFIILIIFFQLFALLVMAVDTISKIYNFFPFQWIFKAGVWILEAVS